MLKALQRVGLIGWNDFRLQLRNRAAVVWLVVMPLTFVYFMGFANRGPGGPRAPRPQVLVDNQDSGFLGAELLTELGTQGLQTVRPDDPDAKRARRGLRVATNFTAEVVAGRSSRVRFFQVSTDPDLDSALVELRLARALVAVNSLLLQHATRHPGIPPSPESLASLRAEPDLVGVRAGFAGRKPIPTGFNLSLPGVLVMYLLMNLLTFGGAAVAGERRRGVLRRALVYPVSRGVLISGKIAGLMAVAALQSVALLLAGRFLFGVNLGDALGGILLTLLVYSWVAASSGVLIGSVLRSEDKVVGVCVLTSMVFSALGGCWWPLEIVPETAQRVAHCLPTGWAVEALHQLITYGSGLEGALPAVGVLALFGLGANLAAVRFFRV